jgi:putative transposase
VFTGAHLERMREIMRAACADSGAELAECNGEAEHVHLLVNFPPTVTVSRLVNSLRGIVPQAAAGIPRTTAALLAGQGPWSGPYFAGSAAGAPISVLRPYTEQQNHPS